MPPEYGMAASIDANGIGAAARDELPSESTDALESAGLAPSSKGFAKSLAKRLNAGTISTAKAAAAIIFTLNLIVAS
jgi:hypothetical protein